MSGDHTAIVSHLNWYFEYKIKTVVAHIVQLFSTMSLRLSGLNDAFIKFLFLVIRDGGGRRDGLCHSCRSSVFNFYTVNNFYIIFPHNFYGEKQLKLSGE